MGPEETERRRTIHSYIRLLNNKNNTITGKKVRVKYKGIRIKKVRMKRRVRKPRPISPQEVIIVRKTKERYRGGAVTLQHILAENGVKMAHNRFAGYWSRKDLRRKSRRRASRGSG